MTRDTIFLDVVQLCSVLVFPCRNFCGENFVIFFYEVKLLFTYLFRAAFKFGRRVHFALRSKMLKMTIARLPAI